MNPGGHNYLTSNTTKEKWNVSPPVSAQHRHTQEFAQQTSYYNPRCACVLKVNNHLRIRVFVIQWNPSSPGTVRPEESD